MKYKLIATDVDGTLGNDNFMISKQNKAALKKAVDHGIKVVLCSGRTPDSLHAFEKEIGLNIPGQYGIGFNGATVYDAYTQQYLFQDGISQETACHIIGMLHQLEPTSLVALYVDSGNLLAEEGLEDVLAQFNNDNLVTIKYVPKITAEMITSSVLNMYCMGERDVLNQIYDALQGKDLKECEVSFTQYQLLEFMPPMVNKAHGIQRLCKHLGIDLSEVVTVGDNYNDIEMIEVAGLGVAVANAVNELKKHANYVTQKTNNEHALDEVVTYVLAENESVR